MPLVYLLYRCPRCGQDPLDGEKDEAHCSACGTRYSRGGEGGLIRVQEASGRLWEVPGHRLAEVLEGWIAEDSAVSEDPELPLHESRVEVRQTSRQSTVRLRGELLGFAEAMGDPFPGTLRLTSTALILWTGTRPKGGSGPGNPSETWPLLGIGAVQTSSNSLQFSPSGGGLVEFRFPEDSPYRWETLLRTALRKAYRRENLGEIIEFQPRIVVE